MKIFEWRKKQLKGKRWNFPKPNFQRIYEICLTRTQNEKKVRVFPKLPCCTKHMLKKTQELRNLNGLEFFAPKVIIGAIFLSLLKFLKIEILLETKKRTIKLLTKRNICNKGILVMIVIISVLILVKTFDTKTVTINNHTKINKNTNKDNKNSKFSVNIVVNNFFKINRTVD